jgi:hypothetical protein
MLGGFLYQWFLQIKYSSNAFIFLTLSFQNSSASAAVPIAWERWGGEEEKKQEDVK